LRGEGELRGEPRVTEEGEGRGLGEERGGRGGEGRGVVRRGVGG
jgi:hypothetical protein